MFNTILSSLLRQPGHAPLIRNLFCNRCVFILKGGTIGKPPWLTSSFLARKIALLDHRPLVHGLAWWLAGWLGCQKCWVAKSLLVVVLLSIGVRNWFAYDGWHWRTSMHSRSRPANPRNNPTAPHQTCTWTKRFASTKVTKAKTVLACQITYSTRVSVKASHFGNRRGILFKVEGTTFLLSRPLSDLLSTQWTGCESRSSSLPFQSIRNINGFEDATRIWWCEYFQPEVSLTSFASPGAFVWLEPFSTKPCRLLGHEECNLVPAYSVTFGDDIQRQREINTRAWAISLVCLTSNDYSWCRKPCCKCIAHLWFACTSYEFSSMRERWVDVHNKSSNTCMCIELTKYSLTTDICCRCCQSGTFTIRSRCVLLGHIRVIQPLWLGP